jgi:hypothetical protein
MPGTEEKNSTPWAATVFTAHGNYGSTVFDPFLTSEAYLKVAICDRCLTAATEDGRVVHCQPRHEIAVNEKLWKVPDV